MKSKKSFFHNTHSQFFSLRKKQKDNFKIGYQSTYVFLIGIIACLLLYYVWILNSNATQGYMVREMEKTQQELKDELNRIESKISEFESINSIENSDIINDMEESDEFGYIIMRDDVQYVYNY